MRVYIKASYDASMPAWLKGTAALEQLNGEFAMSQAKFYPTPMADGVQITLLDTVYLRRKVRSFYNGYTNNTYTVAHDYVYCPEYPARNSDDVCLAVGSKHVSIGSIGRTGAGRAAYNEQCKDTVYMVAPLRKVIRPVAYEPDRSYDAGDGYDKSGYKIPDPEDLYRRLYGKFPDQIIKKVEKLKPILDEYYDTLDSYKDIVTGIDISHGIGYNIYRNSTAVEHFNAAVVYYGELYSAVENIVNGKDGANELATLLGTGRGSVSAITTKIDEQLSEAESALTLP